MSEFDLIASLQQMICLPEDDEVTGCTVGIGDDGAVLEISPQHELVVCTDTLVEGVHFPQDTPSEAIGHKALAVNLSDLAAMGAQPTFFLLALTLPAEDPVWLESFARGMARLARQAHIQLAGGDTSCGPLSITITALGTVEKGQALLRKGANPGDLVVVSGTPGAASWALRAMQNGVAPQPSDRAALEYPEPRLQLGRSLIGQATSCIDLSDGLAADLGHILDQSEVGAEIELNRLPCPGSLAEQPDELRWQLQMAGGDDYELCFTVSAHAASQLAEISGSCGLALTTIGTIVQQPGLVLKTGEGKVFELNSSGYQHFTDSEKRS